MMTTMRVGAPKLRRWQRWRRASAWIAGDGFGHEIKELDGVLALHDGVVEMNGHKQYVAWLVAAES